MALAGIGVVAVEIDTYAGALLLILSHALVLSLLLRNPRKNPAGSQKFTAAALLTLVPVILWLATPSDPLRMTTTIYGLGGGGMAGAAWISGFPRSGVGAGAVLVTAAALSSILGAGFLSGSPVPGAVSWPLFYLGHFLICTGIVQTLRRAMHKPELRQVI